MSYGTPASPGVYGIVAEFDSAEKLLVAAEQARDAGYKRLDAFSPFPIHGLSEATGFNDVRIPWIVFMAAVIGCFAGYTLEWYTAVIDYPLNVGGKPLNSLPAFFPVMYEVTILMSGVTAFLIMLALNGLPRPYHAVFNTPGFERASQDRFFLAIESTDPQFDHAGTFDFMKGLDPLAVSEVSS